MCKPLDKSVSHRSVVLLGQTPIGMSWELSRNPTSSQRENTNARADPHTGLLRSLPSPYLVILYPYISITGKVIFSFLFCVRWCASMDMLSRARRAPSGKDEQAYTAVTASPLSPPKRGTWADMVTTRPVSIHIGLAEKSDFRAWASLTQLANKQAAEPKCKSVVCKYRRHMLRILS